MKHLNSLLFLAVCVMGLSSCGKDTPDPIVAVSIDQDFDVFTSQRIEESGNVPYLVVRSMEPDSCLNAELDAQMTIVDNLITIQINGIIHPEFCQEGEMFLQKEFSIPLELGTYQIEFKKADFLSTSGSLIISEDIIELDIENLGGVFISEKQMNLINENHVWGYFIKDEAVASTFPVNLDEVYSEFVHVVPDITALAEGDYSFFEVLANGDVNIYGIKESALMTAFEMKEIDDWENIGRAIDLVQRNRPDLLYYFTNGRGDIISN